MSRYILKPTSISVPQNGNYLPGQITTGDSNIYENSSVKFGKIVLPHYLGDDANRIVDAEAFDGTQNQAELLDYLLDDSIAENVDDYQVDKDNIPEDIKQSLVGDDNVYRAIAVMRVLSPIIEDASDRVEHDKASEEEVRFVDRVEEFAIYLGPIKDKFEKMKTNPTVTESKPEKRRYRTEISAHQAKIQYDRDTETVEQNGDKIRQQLTANKVDQITNDKAARQKDLMREILLSEDNLTGPRLYTQELLLGRIPTFTTYRQAMHFLEAVRMHRFYVNGNEAIVPALSLNYAIENAKYLIRDHGNQTTIHYSINHY